MRSISAWVVIAAVPTMMAGIYGMNFDNMPELRWHYGYYAVLLLMAVVCTRCTAFPQSRLALTAVPGTDL